MAGYTLVELLVVLAIMGLLLAAAMPMLSTTRPGLQAKAAARALAQDLVAARQEAVDKGIAEHVTLNPMTGRYAISPAGVRRVLPKAIAIAGNAIDFFPDGSSSGGVITVSGAHARHRVTVRWPAGQVAVDE
jgi:general secretion pathway protein H